MYIVQFLLKKILLFSAWDLTAGFTEKVAGTLGRISVSLFGSDWRLKSGIFTGFLTLMEQNSIWREQHDQTCSGGDCQSVISQYLEDIETSAFSTVWKDISSKMQV